MPAETLVKSNKSNQNQAPAPDTWATCLSQSLEPVHFTEKTF